ncbi:MAG: alpha-E domain-containing protein [Desulfocapsaceae bacterium]|nr:alpha-E domain-containing protein [Desulfocapsaceae bacterium]
MLSRVANSVYWMCRYIERAENVARFISVNLNLLLDLPLEEGHQWQPLISITGDRAQFEEKYSSCTQENVIKFLTFDKDYPNSIISCLQNARESARSVREIISSEMWEQLNRFYIEVKEAEESGFAQNDPHKFFLMIKMRGHMFTGLLYSTMSHGEAWHFAKMGLMLERADKISRILDVKYFMLLPKAEFVGAPYDNLQWAAVLKSVSAHDMYRKIFHRISPKQVADFLIFDTEFPRSIRHCISDALFSLHKITGTPQGAARNRAEKILGRLQADMDYTDIDEVLESGMHDYLDGLQVRLNQVGDEISTTFFKLVPPHSELTNQQ